MQPSFNNWYNSKMYATPHLAEETRWVASFLEDANSVVVVGISRKPTKDSYYVGRYLQRAGYQIVPVNPTADAILGEKAYPDIRSINKNVDVVDIFLRPEFIPEAVEQALELNPRCIWLQLGTGSHPELESLIEEAGAKLIQNRCIKVDHQFLIRDKRNG